MSLVYSTSFYES